MRILGVLLKTDQRRGYPDKRIVDADTGATGSSAPALQGGKVEINPTGKRFRIFWHLQNDY